jgi:hypothetical protein
MSRSDLTVLLWLGLLTASISSGCGQSRKQHSSEPNSNLETASLRCTPEQETINGYKDQDGCPDSLARLHISIQLQPEPPLEITGLEVWLPGKSTPLFPDPSGQLIVFELTPYRGFTIELRNPQTNAISHHTIHLKEGANVAEIKPQWVME